MSGEREVNLTGQSGIPPRFAKKVMVPAALVDLMKEWAAARGAALVLAGPFGTGKTQLACVARGIFGLVRQEEADRGKSFDIPPATVEHWSVPALFESVRRSYDDRKAPGPLPDCSRAGLLILDDLAAERPSEWVLEQLFSLVDERYSRQLPLVVTTNKPMDELSAHVGERVASRLAEMTGNGRFVINVSGPDRRRQ